ncbi:hypothetical protein HUK49_07020 [Limosilactobacillus sp. c11Ua_112_M]|uniref:hypothetical protein n=1 Tax=Limosilactobacillus TaxID=2742598 RepID=UPI0017857F11|nr:MULTISPECIES: hypothetical protein [Limosilactobacillus]MBD8087692.1 hypothetical protein [Limosilactobacillus portuensis]MEC4742167.1 hypothetical protein [Limosilactobacillus sp. c10Ua_36]
MLQSVIKLVSPYATTILTGDEANDPNTFQLKYPQIIVQIPWRVEQSRYKLMTTGVYTQQIDLYWNADEMGSLMDTLDKLEILLPHLKLTQYPCEYQTDSLISPQPQVDTTTSTKLIHGVVRADFFITEN